MSCSCRAELKLVWPGSGRAVARQWFQTSNLIQLRQILKYRNAKNEEISPKYTKIMIIYEFSSAWQ